MCFCNNNNNNQPRNLGFNGVYHGFNCGYNPYARSNFGYIGQRGPAGPVGPQGPSGLDDSVYAEVATATVASGAIIPLFQTESTNPTSSTVTSGIINLTEGVYLVTYGFSGTPSSATEGISVTLYSNGTPLANGELIQTGAAEVSASKTILLDFDNSGALSLYNTTATTETVNYPYISVTKLQ